MNLKHILKNKRGVAIENAILFMLVIFTFCALLASLTMIGNLQTKVEDAVLLRDVQIDQIGEDFLSSVRAGESLDKIYENLNITYENYKCTVTGNGEEKVLTVCHKSDELKVVLYVDAVKDGDAVSVRKWCYSLPAQTE